MSKGLMIPDERIEKKILLIRGHKLIIDADLAQLYGVTTKRLNQQVKRNSNRFPKDFMFRLTQKEKDEVVANCNHLSRLRFSTTLPHAFTEHGAIMAASVLNTPRAIESSIFVVRAFVRLRQILETNKELSRKLADLEQRIEGHDEQIQAIFEAIRQLMAPPDKPKKKIGYTVKEKQKAYSKKAKNKKPSTDGSFTPKAKKIWEAIPGIIQFKILNNVWCVQCRKESSIGNLSGKIESGMLVLRGTCTKCNGEVARVIENERF
jgi:hypothetical protein